MQRDEFERVVAEEFERMPSKFKARIKNVALLVEDEPSDELRHLEGLAFDETLLGHYHGIPATERGDGYGVGVVLPDTITLFRIPILDEAEESGLSVRQVIRETIEHEVAHYFGMSEEGVEQWERTKGRRS